MAMGEPDPDHNQKAESILLACDQRDLASLRQLASSQDGLLRDELRRVACGSMLRLVGLLSHAHLDQGHFSWVAMATLNRPAQTWKHCLRTKTRTKCSWMSIARSCIIPKVLKRPSRKHDRCEADKTVGESERTTDARKVELSQVIVAVLRRHPMLHYFQGYHDIVQVLLLVLGIDAALTAVARLSLLRIRDFMLPTMSGTEPHLQLLPSILYAADRALYHHLSQTQPFFALAATLTLYAHDIEGYGDIARLFDFLLASEAAIPVYLFVTVGQSYSRPTRKCTEGSSRLCFLESRSY